MKPVIYLVTCGAPLASRIADGITEASKRGWEPVVIPTEASRKWIPEGALDNALVATDHRDDINDQRLPPADAIAVVPTTFNTLTAWANGTANTYPLVKLCAALGAQTPTVAVPFAKHDLAGHPAWLASLAVLRYAGVTIVDPHTGQNGKADPIQSGTGETVANSFEWQWVLNSLERYPMTQEDVVE